MIYIYAYGITAEEQYCRAVALASDVALTSGEIQIIKGADGVNSIADAMAYVQKFGNRRTDILVMPTPTISQEINNFFQLYPAVNVAMPFSTLANYGFATNAPNLYSLSPDEIPAIISCGAGQGGVCDMYTGLGLEFVDTAIYQQVGAGPTYTPISSYAVTGITNSAGVMVVVNPIASFGISKIKVHISGVVSTFANTPNGAFNILSIPDNSHFWVQYDLGAGSYTSGGIVKIEWLSGSVANIAAKIHKIAKARNCSIPEARLYARLTGSQSGTRDNTHGYGVIDTTAAIASVASVGADPYDVLGAVGASVTVTYFIAEGKATFNHPEIENAKQIALYSNDILTNTITMSPGEALNFVRDNIPLYNQEFKIKGLRDGRATAFSGGAASNVTATFGYPKESKFQFTSSDAIVYYIDAGGTITKSYVIQVIYRVDNNDLLSVPKQGVLLKLNNGDTISLQNAYGSLNALTAGNLNRIFNRTSPNFFYLNSDLGPPLSIDPFLASGGDYAGMDYTGTDFTNGGSGDISMTHVQWAYNNLTNANLGSFNTLEAFLSAITIGTSYINEDTVIWRDGRILGKSVFVKLKTFLQGGYSASANSGALFSAAIIPLTQPFKDSQFTYNGSESVAAIPAGVCDWVYLELRPDEFSYGSLNARRAAFLMTDGTIKDLDGVSTVRFPGVAPTYYFVVIGHRNHLPIMTPAAVLLGSTSTLYDFTTAANKAYGADQKDLGGGKFGMYAGDADKDFTISSNDVTVITAALSTSGYKYEDVNLSGAVSSPDNTLATANIGKVGQVPHYGS